MTSAATLRRFHGDVRLDKQRAVQSNLLSNPQLASSADPEVRRAPAVPLLLAQALDYTRCVLAPCAALLALPTAWECNLTVFTAFVWSLNGGTRARCGDPNARWPTAS